MSDDLTSNEQWTKKSFEGEKDGCLFFELSQPGLCQNPPASVFSLILFGFLPTFEPFLLVLSFI